ncbi:hypothetical protein ASE03_19665 [Kitasatospora sp. Root187]|nr:hypothetical protein ASE03_19665 [Kitasatospora sp. Root187]
MLIENSAIAARSRFWKLASGPCTSRIIANIRALNFSPAADSRSDGWFSWKNRSSGARSVIPAANRRTSSSRSSGDQGRPSPQAIASSIGAAMLSTMPWTMSSLVLKW